MTSHIPDGHAQILWNEHEDGKIIDICAVDFRDTELQETIAGRYECSNGADTADWLTDKHPIANPAGLFACLAFHQGFDGPAVARECVREFAQLDGCEWARQMLAAVERGK